MFVSFDFRVNPKKIRIEKRYLYINTWVQICMPEVLLITTLIR